MVRCGTQNQVVCYELDADQRWHGYKIHTEGVSAT